MKSGRTHYITSVASVLRHWKYNPAADPHIKLLIRAFRLEWPVQHRIMPKWDLHLVLSALLSPPFASEFNDRGRIYDGVIDLRWWMMKTVFLLVLASARRRSYEEIPSIRRWCPFYRKPEFWLRTSYRHRLSNGSQSQVSPHLDPDVPEWMLCPVRQLKPYLRDTERILVVVGGGGGGGVFIHWNGEREIKFIEP